MGVVLAISNHPGEAQRIELCNRSASETHQIVRGAILPFPVVYICRGVVVAFVYLITQIDLETGAPGTICLPLHSLEWLTMRFWRQSEHTLQRSQSQQRQKCGPHISHTVQLTRKTEQTSTAARMQEHSLLKPTTASRHVVYISPLQP